MDIPIECVLAKAIANVFNRVSRRNCTHALQSCCAWVRERWVRCDSMQSMFWGLYFVCAESTPLLQYDRQTQNFLVFENTLRVSLHALKKKDRELLLQNPHSLKTTMQPHLHAFSNCARREFRQQLEVGRFAMTVLAGMEVALGRTMRTACDEGFVACAFCAIGTTIAETDVDTTAKTTNIWNSTNQTKDAIRALCAVLRQYRSAVSAWDSANRKELEWPHKKCLTASTREPMNQSCKPAKKAKNTPRG